MRSGHAAEFSLPVIAAGVGVRRGSGWAIRSASFRLGPPGSGPALTAAELGPVALGPATRGPGAAGPSTLGIATLDPGWPTSSRPGGPLPVAPAGRHSARRWAARERAAEEASRLLISVLAGRIAPAHGSLIVLGEDMSAPEGRAAVRGQVGVARGRGPVWPGLRIRALVEYAAWRARQPGRDRYLLVAAILDRLALTWWSEVPLRAAPPLIAAKARLAAAMVYQPRLLLIDGVLDELGAADQVALTGVIRVLARDTPVITAGRDAVPLGLACSRVLTLTEGILAGPPAEPAWPATYPAAGLDLPAYLA